MKYILALTLIFCLFTACKKEQLNTEITGRWELATRDGGFSAMHIDYAAGNGAIILLGQNGEFKTYSHDTLTNAGMYSLSQMPACGANNIQTFITTTIGANSGSVVYVKNGYLNFDVSCIVADGFSYTYRRLGN